MTALTWVLESSVFSDRHASLKVAIDRCGDQWIEWNDDWWLDGIPSNLADEHVRVRCRLVAGLVLPD